MDTGKTGWMGQPCGGNYFMQSRSACCIGAKLQGKERKGT